MLGYHSTQTLKPMSLSPLCYFSHSHLWHLSSMKLNLSTITLVYSTISPSRQSLPYYNTPPQNEAFYWTYKQSKITWCLIWAWSHHAVFNLSIPQNPCLCLRHVPLLLPQGPLSVPALCTFAPNLGTLVYAPTMQLCPYSRNPCPCSHYASLPLL